MPNTAIMRLLLHWHLLPKSQVVYWMSLLILVVLYIFIYIIIRVVCGSYLATQTQPFEPFNIEVKIQ